MLTVAINSATQRTSAALLKNGKLLAEKSWISNKDEAEKILPAIQALLKKTKNRWQDITEIFVVTGPGPFTGLRIGVTVANALAWSTGSPIRTSGVFECIRTQIGKKFLNKTAVVVKGGGDYIALALPQSKKEKLIELKNFPIIFKKTGLKYICTEMKPQELAALKKLFKAQKISARFVTPKELKTFGHAAEELLKTSKKSLKLAKPLYLQKPHITQSKKPVFV